MKSITEIIKELEESTVDTDLKEMVIKWVRFAHQVGFEEGMKRVAETQSKLFDLMMPKVVGDVITGVPADVRIQNDFSYTLKPIINKEEENG